MALEHLELLAIFETDDVFRRHRLLDGDGWLRLLRLLGRRGR
jgi:hypothetical protein